MGRILCLDYGLRHTGVAVSDETRTIAQALRTIEHQDDDALIAAARRLVAEHAVDEVVIGLPLGQAGKPSTRSEQVRRFGERLGAALGLPVRFQDERYSTWRAAEVLSQAAARPRRSALRGPRRPPSAGSTRACHGAVDRIAATIILEDYLEARRSAEK
jgi:putative Holliday junction resolvase